MQQTFEQELTREEYQKLQNKRFGLFLFQISWIMAFVCLIVVNLHLRSNFVAWPPEGVERLSVTLPAIATVALLISRMLIHRSQAAFLAGNATSFLKNWRFTLGLACAFVLIMAFEWVSIPIPEAIRDQQYATVFRLMTAFHGFHALVIGIYLWRVGRMTRASGYDHGNLWLIEAGVRLWDFVTIAWILFFIVLYVI